VSARPCTSRARSRSTRQGNSSAPAIWAPKPGKRFANLAFVLKIGGATPADVAKLTIYVVNYSPRDFEAIREAGAGFLPARNPPAGIIVGVQSLPLEGLLIAVDATAVIRAMFQPRQR